MKTKTFQMRMSKETKENLDRLSKHFNLSASAVVDMLICSKTREVAEQKQTKTI